MAVADRYLNVGQAAERLGTNRRRVWQLIKDGTLPSTVNPLDRREKLIPLERVEELAERARARPARPVFLSDGAGFNPNVHSDEIEDYLAANWRPG